MIHGTDYLRMTAELLDAIHLCDVIGNQNKRVALKPNLLPPITAQSHIRNWWKASSAT